LPLSSDKRFDALVAGHVCLDIIPGLENGVEFQPGQLVEAGKASLSPGGAVSNVGTILSRVGVRTKMVAQIGDDPMGRLLEDLLRENAPLANREIALDPKESTSYTIVLNLSGQDRMFLHCPGANRSFRSSTVSDEALQSARLMHFGYPPLMEAIYAKDGRELADLFRRAKGFGVTTSLDMSLPDENSPSGQIDWPKLLSHVLPFVDYFLPSLDELAYMLDRPLFHVKHDPVELANRALGLGAKSVGIKLGDRGLYYLSGGGEEFWQPCFAVEVAGTTGSGDATIAGFLTGVLQGLGVAECLRLGCVVGACCCEKPDAVSGVRDLSQVLGRMGSG
jgi:sugar/nucleoside kinase (ribokinase family)